MSNISTLGSDVEALNVSGETMEPINLSDLYSVRMIVLIEDEPQSNLYRQILFTRDEFKKMAMCVDGIFPKEEDHSCGNPQCKGTMIAVSDNRVVLPAEIQEVHECQDLDKCNC